MSSPASKKTLLSSDSKPYIELNNRGQRLRFDLDQNMYRLGRNPAWSDAKNIPSNWEVMSRHHAVLHREKNGYRIYDGDGQGKLSSNGLWVDRVRIKASGHLLTHGTQLEIGQDPQNHIVISYFDPDRSESTAIPSKRRLNLSKIKEWPVELGREPNPNRYASMQLDAPTISRFHATIVPNPQGGYKLVDLSTNGTFVNSQPVAKSVQLKEGDTIQIGPFTLILRGDILELYDRGNQIRLDAHNLYRTALDQEKKEKVILNQISLPIEPGQLVALVGGSGTGKSTLLGIAPTQTGTVYINGKDLRQNFDIYRSQIGYVPQDDIVYSDLTVTEVLTYSCQLRLPPETNVQQAVAEALKQVKLDFVKDNFVRDLSGGQRKRVSIAVELLADPKLFFLDEPTSGLDPGLDKAMMELLRNLANQGRTVILVTHATANLAVCDRVAFLGRGGRLCYFGPPEETMQFFGVQPDLKYFADIYLKLEAGHDPEAVDQVVKRWASKFRANSEPYNNYVKAALSFDPSHPSEGEEKTIASVTPVGKQPVSGKAKVKHHSGFKQLGVLSRRYLQLTGRDRANLAWSLLPAPVGIILTALTIGRTPFVASDPPAMTQAPDALKVLFVFTFAALLAGLLSSLPEIVKEASVYLRERLVNLGLIPYLTSKLLVRSALAVIQTLSIVLIILIFFQSPSPELIPWFLGLSITTFLTILTALSLGLAISALARTASAAMNSLTLILLPQIIFSGVLFNLEGAFGTLVSWLTISRWSVGAYGALVNVNALVPEAPPQMPGFPPTPQPFAPTPVYDPTWENLLLNWGILCLHTAVYLAITWGLQKRKDIF